MRRIVPPVASALALLVFAGGSAATPTENEWTALGPGGSQVLALAASPADTNVLYAATDGRIWKSADSGDSWTETAAGATGSSALAADPADADNVVASPWSGDLEVTNDGGTHWSSPTSGPTAGSTPLLSWTSAGLFAVIDGTLYTSADRGDHWSAVGTPPGGGARALLVVASDAIYVGSELGTVQFSDDGGATWEDRSSGLPTEIEPGYPVPPSVERLVFDPADPQVLYAEASPLGLWRSEDGGGNWEVVTSPVADRTLERVAVLATSPSTLIATVGTNVARSTDGGASWTTAGGPPTSIGSGLGGFFPEPTEATTVYLAGRGVYRSDDGGDTFALHVEGLGKGSVNSLSPTPGAGTHFFAATEEGVFKTDDDGQTWSHASEGMHGQAMDVAADPADADRFYLVAAGDLWLTEDAGANWGPELTPTEVVYAVATAPGSVVAGSSTTIYRSTDDGSTWASTALPLVNDFVNDVAIDPTNENRVYAGTTDGLFRSADGGSTWTRIDPRHISNVSLAPDGIAYVLAEGAIAAFAPNGTSQATSSIGLSTYAYSLAADPDNADVVYVGTPSGLYRSADGGQRFVKLPTTGLDSTFISDIVPRGPGHIMVAGPKGTASIDLSPLSASVDAATNVTSSGADLSGLANPAGSNANAFFEYGTTKSYGSATPSTGVGDGSSDVPVAASVSSLAHATTYHYRLVVQTSNGIAASPDATFTTDFTQPTVTTSPADQLTDTGARLKGSVNPQGAETTYWFEYGPDTSYGTATSSVSAGAGKAGVAVSANITGLDPATTYHFRAVAQNAKGTAYGADREFATANIPPTMDSVDPITLRDGAIDGGSVPIRVSWSATPGTGPICMYQVQFGSESEGGPFVWGQSPIAELLAGASPPTVGLYYSVAALGCDSTQSGYLQTPPTDVRMPQENATSVTRSKGWARIESSDASGHHVLRTTTPGASVAFRFTGRSFAWIAPTGVKYADVTIAVDGGTATRVPLYSSTRKVQQLLYVVNFDSVAKRRVVVTARRAADRTRVDLDAFAFLS
jgi:photosystem II stability/assembly factor-like uncharacterized protein